MRIPLGLLTLGVIGVAYPQTSQEPFSVTISTRTPQAQVGAHLNIEMAMKNTSGQPIDCTVWNVAHSWDGNYKYEVFREDGQPAPKKDNHPELLPSSASPPASSNQEKHRFRGRRSPSFSISAARADTPFRFRVVFSSRGQIAQSSSQILSKLQCSLRKPSLLRGWTLLPLPHPAKRFQAAADGKIFPLQRKPPP